MSNENSVVVFSCQIQPQHCHGIGNSAISCFQVKSNHNIVMLVEIQPFPFSQVCFHVKLTTNLHHVLKFQPFSLPCQNGLIQTSHILEFALPCKIFIDHSPRHSSKETILVNNLSCSDTTSENNLTLINCKRSQKSSGWPTSYMVCNANPNSCIASLPTSIVDFCMLNLSKKV